MNVELWTSRVFTKEYPQRITAVII